MLSQWAIAQTIPSVVGTVARAMISGTMVAPAVPKMKSRTSVATGSAIRNSPRFRSESNTGCRSLFTATWPVR